MTAVEVDGEAFFLGDLTVSFFFGLATIDAARFRMVKKLGNVKRNLGNVLNRTRVDSAASCIFIWKPLSVVIVISSYLCEIELYDMQRYASSSIIDWIYLHSLKPYSQFHRVHLTLQSYHAKRDRETWLSRL